MLFIYYCILNSSKLKSMLPESISRYIPSESNDDHIVQEPRRDSTSQMSRSVFNRLTEAREQWETDVKSQREAVFDRRDVLH